MANRQNTPQPGDPLGLLNDPGEVFRGEGQVEFVRRLISAIRSAFSSAVLRDRATPDFLLSAPSGKVFKVTVDETGAIKTAPVRG